MEGGVVILKISATRDENRESAWWQAVRLIQKSILYPAEKLPVLQGFDPNFLSSRKSLSQHLYFGVLRNLSLLDALLQPYLRKQPRAGLYALLRVSAFEILAARREPSRIPKIIDHAVGMAKTEYSRNEAGMVNAVLRRVSGDMESSIRQFDIRTVFGLEKRYSHPAWMIHRWVQFYGLEATRDLLAWNQEYPQAYLALRAAEATGQICGLQSTPWPCFFAIEDDAGWEVAQKRIGDGTGYIQDPATARAAEAAGVEKGMAVLDLCSAPGGKAWQLAGYNPGLLVSVDRKRRGSGVRFTQWISNLERMSGNTYRVECDLLIESLECVLGEHSLPTHFDRVLIDAPCSNTGVIRRRPEVRWRLTPEAIVEQVETQKQLLQIASQHVKPGGRLVYSTCSLEPEENSEVADYFTQVNGARFELLNGWIYKPWETGHDGAGVTCWQCR